MKNFIIERSRGVFRISMPWSLLNHPDYLMLVGETKLNELTLDFFPWKIFNLE